MYVRLCSVYDTIDSLEADFIAEKLHPKDLKAALVKIINEYACYCIVVCVCLSILFQLRVFLVVLPDYWSLFGYTSRRASLKNCWKR